MFEHLVVPVDGSEESLAAVPIAVAMAEQVAGTVEVVTVVDPVHDDVAAESAKLSTTIEHLGARFAAGSVVPTTLVLAGDDVAETIVDHVTKRDGAMVLMSSHGRGRSAAVFGSTADQLLRRMFGPIIVIGPRAAQSKGHLDGDYIVPLDGSASADTVLPIVGAWMVEFHGTPWIVEVIDANTYVPDDSVETAMVSRHARQLRASTGRSVEVDVLRDDSPGRAIAATAHGHDASLIFIATHSRAGMSRLRSGSVTAGVIRHAECPVVVYRPPEVSADPDH